MQSPSLTCLLSAENLDKVYRKPVCDAVIQTDLDDDWLPDD
ncbi:hypothetical protein [Thiohalocapsa sp.]|nr:hypothetical protein [Thiohalocapsa sp.]